MLSTNHWKSVPNTPDFEFESLVAIYHHTHYSGYAVYYVYDKSLSQSLRTARKALSVGGLPDKSLANKLIETSRK